MSKYQSKTKKGFAEIPQNDPEADPEAILPAKGRSKQSWASRLCPLLYLLSGLIVGGYLGSNFNWERNLAQRCISYISEDCVYSPVCHHPRLIGAAPVVQEVGIEFDVIHFNGSLFKRNAFRQDAGIEVDEAWGSLGVDCKLLCPLLKLANFCRSSCYCTHRNSRRLGLDFVSCPS